MLPPCRFLCLAVAFALAVPGGLRAQSVFLLRTQEGQILKIQAADGLYPEALVDGHLRKIRDVANLMLRRVPAYCDGFVQINGFQTADALDADGGTRPDLFSATADIVPDRSYKNVVLLLVFDTGDLEMCGLDDLDANVHNPLKLHLPEVEGRDLQHTHCAFHLFSEGREILTSLATPKELEEGKQKTDATILAATANRGLAAVLMVAPKRPADVPADLSGTASVRCHIGTDGSVLDAALVDATDPEFGQAAVDAARQWLFAPMIKNHQYVEVTVRIPFVFHPAPPARPKQD